MNTKPMPIDLYNSIENSVRHLLETDQRCRRDDLYLTIRYWERFSGVVFTEEQKDRLLRFAPAPESIRRIRQKLQERGNYMPPPEVVKARHKSAEAHRQAFRMR